MVLSATLLVFIKNLENPVHKAGGHAPTFLLFCSYGAVVFNFSAALSSLVLTDKLGNIPTYCASQDLSLPNADVVSKYIITFAKDVWCWLGVELCNVAL